MILWSTDHRITGYCTFPWIRKVVLSFLVCAPLFKGAVQSYTLAIVPLLKGIVQQVLRGVNTKLR
jgi:hypothetical protein